SYLTLWDGTQRITFPLVQAGRADQSKGAAGRKVFGQFAVIAQRQRARLVHAVDALVRDQRPWPHFLILEIVLDEDHLVRIIDRSSRLDQVNSAVEECVGRTSAAAPHGQQVIVGRSGGVSHAAPAAARRPVAAVVETCQSLEAVTVKGLKEQA